MSDDLPTIEELEQARAERDLPKSRFSKLVGYKNGSSWTNATRRGEINDIHRRLAAAVIEHYDNYGELPASRSQIIGTPDPEAEAPCLIPDRSVPITDPQLEAVTAALECGYYEVPRGVTLIELADRLGCSHQALSQRLRHAHQNIIEAIVGGDADATAEFWTGRHPGDADVVHTTPNCSSLSATEPKRIDHTLVEWHGLETCDDCPSELTPSNPQAGGKVFGGAD